MNDQNGASHPKTSRPANNTEILEVSLIEQPTVAAAQWTEVEKASRCALKKTC
jgi:hypothetical protein